MIYRRSVLLFLVLILAFLLILPGSVFAESTSTSSKDTASYTLVIEAPKQIEAGKTLTLVVQVRENLYDDLVANARVDFFVRSDFFINDLVKIGEAVTDEKGLAKIDYIPNQPGALHIVATYKADSNLEPAEAEGTVNITGSIKPLYSTKVGIQYPHSFIIWMISIVIMLFAIWGTFLFVLYQVQNISSRGTGAKGAAFILIVGAAVIFTVLVLVLVTPEAQYNFGYLP
ncbi:MAG: hypothetical protein ACYCXB_07830 [Candidatus Humimicrobiaceae bacterium]